MEQAQKRLAAELALLEKALDTLVRATQEPLTDLVRDATIQRFEYVFELSWKTMQIAANYMGTICRSPRESIKAAFKLGWIENVERWIECLEARNQTSHTYHEGLALEVYDAAKEFPPLVQELVVSLKKL